MVIAIMSLVLVYPRRQSDGWMFALFVVMDGSCCCYYYFFLFFSFFFVKSFSSVCFDNTNR